MKRIREYFKPNWKGWVYRYISIVFLCRPQIFQADAEYYSQDIKEIIHLWESSHEALKIKICRLMKESIPLEIAKKLIVCCEPLTLFFG